MSKKSEQITNDENVNENENNNGASLNEISGQESKIDKAATRFNTSIHYITLSFLIFPFWSIVFGVALAILDLLKDKNETLFTAIQSGVGIGFSCVWIVLTLIVMKYLLKKATESKDASPNHLKNLSRLATKIFVGIIVTFVVLNISYIYSSNIWMFNLTILYLLILSFFTAKRIVKLYEWVFTGNAVNEDIKLKLSFLNKVLASGFGLIATILGIALTIKNLFS